METAVAETLLNLSQSFLSIDTHASETVTLDENSQSDADPSSVNTIGSPSASPEKSPKKPKDKLEQNRVAQRQFRERRKLYIHKLESKVSALHKLEKQVKELTFQNQQMSMMLLTEQKVFHRDRMMWSNEKNSLLRFISNLEYQLNSLHSLHMSRSFGHPAAPGSFFLRKKNIHFASLTFF
jgi:hypothetical protein